MILIHPPVTKPCEPPAGLARLSGALIHHGIRHVAIDANIEGQMYLMHTGEIPSSRLKDRWSARALRNLTRNLASIKDWAIYRSIDRYRLAVSDINRALQMSIPLKTVEIGLGNYQDKNLSPLRSADLLFAADHPELNPFYPYFSRRLSDLIEAESPSVIGFSLTYLSQAICTFAMLGFLRREYPDIILICGGGLVTSWLRRECGTDAIEKLFAGLVDHFIEGNGEEALLSLAGIHTNTGTFYRPNYGDMPLSRYMSPGVILPYSGSSGCVWRKCSFCPEKAEGTLWRPIGTKQVLEELSDLTEEMRPVLIHLLDNAISSSLLRSLIDKPPGVPWYGFVRIENELTDIDYCMALKRSGCAMLKIGIESGDQSVLDRMQKGIDLGTVARALVTLKRAGIAVYVYLLFGTPQETLAGARKTLEFTVQHSTEIDFLNLALFNMPVGMPDNRHFKTSEFYDGDLSLYTDFEHPDGWGRKQVRHFLEKEFKGHPAISAILSKEPLLFTSNHAPFFVME